MCLTWLCVSLAGRVDSDLSPALAPPTLHHGSHHERFPFFSPSAAALSVPQKQFSHHCSPDWPIFFLTRAPSVCAPSVRPPNAISAHNSDKNNLGFYSDSFFFSHWLSEENKNAPVGASLSLLNSLHSLGALTVSPAASSDLGADLWVPLVCTQTPTLLNTINFPKRFF